MPVTTFLARALDGSSTVIQCIQICLFGWCIACCSNGDIAFCGENRPTARHRPCGIDAAYAQAFSIGCPLGMPAHIRLSIARRKPVRPQTSRKSRGAGRSPVL